MSAQSQINTITGMITGGIMAAGNVAKKVSNSAVQDQPSSQSVSPDNNKDLEKAIKARKEMQSKINAIMYNKEISRKAKTRRVGKLLDEYDQGGK